LLAKVEPGATRCEGFCLQDIARAEKPSSKSREDCAHNTICSGRRRFGVAEHDLPTANRAWLGTLETLAWLAFPARRLRDLPIFESEGCGQ
jgi:hypothetical protein